MIPNHNSLNTEDVATCTASTYVGSIEFQRADSKIEKNNRIYGKRGQHSNCVPCYSTTITKWAVSPTRYANRESEATLFSDALVAYNTTKLLAAGMKSQQNLSVKVKKVCT